MRPLYHAYEKKKKKKNIISFNIPLMLVSLEKVWSHPFSDNISIMTIP